MTTEDKPVWQSDLSCTFCGPGTWASWDVVTDDCVVFVCDIHHVEISESKVIQLERRMGEKTWKKIKEGREIIYAEEYQEDLEDFRDMNDYEQGWDTDK